jgi:hypothetical protein
MVFVIVACGPCGSNDDDFDVAVCDDGGGKSGNDERNVTIVDNPNC